MTYKHMLADAHQWGVQVLEMDDGKTVVFEKNAIAWMERTGRSWRAFTRGAANQNYFFGPTTKARAADWCISSAVDPR